MGRPGSIGTWNCPCLHRCEIKFLVHKVQRQRLRMSFKPLSEADKATLDTVYYKDGVFAGRDRLYFLVKERFPEFKGSQRAVLDWLKHQTTWQQAQRPHAHKSVQPLTVTGPGYGQADLAIMTGYKDRGFDAILLVTDGFSKMLWAQPLRGQSETVAIAAVRNIVETEPRPQFKVMQTDHGSHFQARWTEALRELGIKHLYSKARTPTSNAFVERYVGTLKRILFAQMEAQGDKRWVEFLPKAVENINNLRSFATGLTPKELHFASEDVVDRVAKRLKARTHKRHKDAGHKVLHVGQRVRLKRDLGRLGKAGSKGYWTELVYIVCKRVNSKHPNIAPSYKVKGMNGHVLQGRYPYTSLLAVPPFLVSDSTADISQARASTEPEPEPEPMQTPRRSTRQEGEYEVDYISDKRRVKVRGKFRVEYLVHWVGYREPSWEPVANLANSKEAITDFEREG